MGSQPRFTVRGAAGPETGAREGFPWRAGWLWLARGWRQEADEKVKERNQLRGGTPIQSVTAGGGGEQRSPFQVQGQRSG